MIGAILGDIVGSIYEFDNIKTKEFELFDKDCLFTDDSVMTIAIAEALLQTDCVNERNVEEFKEKLIDVMHEIGIRYPDCGYGGHFLVWILRNKREPYNSFGNGSAMRVSSVGWYAKTLEEAELIAKATAEVSHNHPEGIKGAVATAGAVFLARTGATMYEIKKYISDYYTIDFTIDEIRPTYDYDITCQGTVPQAMQAFFESESFEDAIRNAISIGGDSDTLAAITGAVAEAYYGIPDELQETALSYLDERLLNIVERFKDKF
jgi:type I restriction enzyme M protein